MTKSIGRARAAIRAAVPDDAELLLSLIRELAEYERLAHEVKTSVESLHSSLFGPGANAEAVLAEVDGEAVGYAIFFTSFSSFTGQPGIYMEDIYVRPSHRGQGIGRTLLSHVAWMARQRDCARLEWAVLNWNEPSIQFYKSLGAQPMSEWTTYRVAGDALRRLADSAGPG